MTEPAPSPLQPLSEDWERALCVVAHPDDLEFGAAAAVARWTGQGKQVVYCMVTSGEAGIDGLQPDESRAVREAEQVESARIVGVDEVDFLGLRDGVLEYGVALRRAIAEEVRLHRPDIVVTNNFRDSWGGRNLNQADHIATGKATLDAVRDAGNRWIFPEQVADGLEPWGGVREVWCAGSPDATHAVDITETFDTGVAVAEGAPGLHRGSGLGRLRPGRVPRGHVPRGRPASRHRARDRVRGVPDGLGLLSRRSHRLVVKRATGPSASTPRASRAGTPPSRPSRRRGRLRRSRLADHRFVASRRHRRGLGGLLPTSARAVYRGFEHSVYVAARRPARRGRRLLHRLVASTEAAGIWTIQSGSSPRTPPASRCTTPAASATSASVAGRPDAVRPCAGRWRDVVLVERRSEVVGVQPSAGRDALRPLH